MSRSTSRAKRASTSQNQAWTRWVPEIEECPSIDSA
jgi:hypothetical protein